MASTNSYPIAAGAATEIHDRFAQLAIGTEEQSRRAELLPSVSVIETIINAAFWASLRKEENRIPTISLAFLSPGDSKDPLVFERSITLGAAELAKLSPAVERPGIHLGVWPENGELRVWGTTLHVPRLAFVLEVISPGLLVAKHRKLEGPGKFVNVAVLEGDRARLLDHRPPRLLHCPVLFSSLLGFESPSAWVESANVLVQLAVSMRNHRRGGTLLVVPSAKEVWRDSIIHPITYSVPAYAQLARLIADDAHAADDLNHAVEAVAGFTAVDGATIITDRYELMGFGAKIKRRDGATPIDRVVLLEPVAGSESSIVPPGQLGGTRHLSAAQFVHDQPEAVGMVASQDGEFTIFLWSPEDEMVHAHRITVFLL